MSVKRSHIILLVLLLVLMTGLVYLAVVINTKHKLSEPNADASVVFEVDDSTSYNTLTGEQINFADFKGKKRIVTVWASWNPTSGSDLEILEKIASNYDTKKVVFLAINRKEPLRRVEAFLSNIQPLENVIVIMDEFDTFFKNIAGYAMPETVFFDETGMLVEHLRGPLTEAKVQDWLSE